MANVNIMRPDQKFLEERGVMSWPIWEKEISEFPWTYEATEECYILEGKVEVTTDDGVFHLEPGDFVTFAKGLICKWKISVPVRKHYKFL